MSIPSSEEPNRNIVYRSPSRSFYGMKDKIGKRLPQERFDLLLRLQSHLSAAVIYLAHPLRIVLTPTNRKRILWAKH